LSRDVEVVAEMIDASVRKKVSSLEALAREHLQEAAGEARVRQLRRGSHGC